MNEQESAPRKPAAHNLSGFWISTYKYHSSVRNGDFVARHYVWLRHNGEELTVESLADLNDSYMAARFSLRGDVATGTWEDRVSQQGEYRKHVYYGVAQMILSNDGKSLQGKWVGFGQNLEIKSGPWEIRYVGKTLPKEPLE